MAPKRPADCKGFVTATAHCLRGHRAVGRRPASLRPSIQHVRMRGMTRCSRTGRVLRWVGASACVLLLLLWAVSLVGNTDYKTPSWSCHSGQGAFTVVHRTWSGEPWSVAQWEQEQADGSGPHWDRNMAVVASPWRRLGFFLPRFGGIPVYEQRIPPGPDGVLYLQVRTLVIVLPCWLLLLPIALLTAVLWWRDRRRFPAGHCTRCGYNLTGNVPGRCLECGSTA
jgi:hypothetical protein